MSCLRLVVVTVTLVFFVAFVPPGRNSLSQAFRPRHGLRPRQTQVLDYELNIYMDSICADPDRACGEACNNDYGAVDFKCRFEVGAGQNFEIKNSSGWFFGFACPYLANCNLNSQ